MKLPENLGIVYLLWLLSTLLSIVCVIAGRTILMAILSLTPANYWQLSFADRASVFLFGTFALGFVLYLEHAYRRSNGSGLLWGRFFKTFKIQIGIIVLSYALPAIIEAV